MVYILGSGAAAFYCRVKTNTESSIHAESIFHIKDKESFVIVRELGFANICMGAAGII